MSLPDGGPARTPTTGRPGPHCAERRFASASATECARLRTDLQNAVRRRRPLTPALMKKSSAIATRRRRRRQPVKRGAYGGGALAAMRAGGRPASLGLVLGRPGWHATTTGRQTTASPLQRLVRFVSVKRRARGGLSTDSRSHAHLRLSQFGPW